MNELTDSQEKEHWPPFPGAMLPRDGGVIGAPDANEGLIRAISRYRAVQAMRHGSFRHGSRTLPGIQDFRQRALHDHLLDLEDLESWVDGQAERDGEPTIWLSGLPLRQEDYQVNLVMNTLTVNSIAIPLDRMGDEEPFTAWEHPGVSHRLLVYPHPDGWARKKPVRDGGVLDWLRRLSLALAEIYQWEPWQGAAFTVTGLLPYDYHALAGVERMRVDGRRPREISTKHLELACFTAENEGVAQSELMAHWNTMFPDWVYSLLTNFTRDGKQARERLHERIDAVRPPDTLAHLSNLEG